MLMLSGPAQLILFIVFTSSYVHSARILGVFQFPSYSHQIIYQQIWKELARRGHDVVVVTPSPLNDPTLKTLKEIDVGYIKNLIAAKDELQESMSKDSPTTEIMKSFYSVSLVLQEAILKDKQFEKLYNNSKEKFDLILIECLHPGMYALAGKFNAPIIGVSSLGVTVATHGTIGNTNHPILYPDMNLPTHFDLNIFEKIYSTYFNWFLYVYYNHQVVPQADKVARKYLGDDLPYLGDLGNNVSFLLINTNHIIHNVRPNLPKIIQMGQIHIRPPKKLPQELNDILNSAQNGVVYFSLGSNVKSVNLKKNQLNVILEAMSELPYTFLWKWESDDQTNIPKNVITRKWTPQQDVLAHPNIKAFVTQGGLQSIEEAISREVPMVGLPFIGDQPMNVNKIAQVGIAIALDPVTVTKDELKKAITDVATKQSYRDNIHRVRLQMEDQPETGLQRAIWWIEYATRHKGAPHLRSATADVSWWNYLFLDIILFIVFIILFFIKLIHILVKIMSYVPKDKQM